MGKKDYVGTEKLVRGDSRVSRGGDTFDERQNLSEGGSVKILVSKGILPCPPLSPRRNTCHGLVYVTVAFFNQF